MSEEYKKNASANNTALERYKAVYQSTLAQNKASYPKGIDVASNESTKTLSRELKVKSSGLRTQLTGELQKAKNILQIHAVLHAFIEAHYQANIEANEFFQFLFKHLVLIEQSVSEYAELDEAKLESKSTQPTSSPNFLKTPVSTSNVSFFASLPKVLLKEVYDYCQLTKDESKFLQHVARGEQNEAEAMLKMNPQLLLCRGKMVEHNGRTFESATAFQYAVWAKDTHMLTMLMKYPPKESPLRQAIKEQLQEFKTKGLTY